MSTPKRQHVIPKSYLRQFAEIDGEKSFVEAYNINSEDLKYPFSLNNLCVSKNIYTLQAENIADKYVLEKFYAENIDGVYPEVYKLLTDIKIIHITEEQRQKILYTTLSLYFRTSRFLNAMNSEVDDMLDRIIEKTNGRHSGKLFVMVKGREYQFEIAELEAIRAKIKADNKIEFIFSHLNEWQNFVQHKYNSQITVSYILDDINLISCDNPVRIYNHKGYSEDIFDPNNSIQLPLDQKHLLWISPNTDDCERNMIYRGVRDKWFAITSNHSIQQDATDWIFSKKGCITKHFEEQKKHDNFEPENLHALENIKTLATELNKFMLFAEEHGLTSEESLAKIRELKKIPAFQNDVQFNLLCSELRLNGFDV